MVNAYTPEDSVQEAFQSQILQQIIYLFTVGDAKEHMGASHDDFESVQ